jgi:hypothetical protein
VSRRRQVRRGEEFLRQARALFPEEQSPGGGPTFDEFERGPLLAAETTFKTAFDVQLQPLEGVPSLRQLIIAPSSYFAVLW